MSPKVFAALAAVTAVSVVGAAISLSMEYGEEEAARVEEPVFPGLLDRANDVAAITVIHHDGQFALKRDGDVWRVSTLNDYPARSEVARKVIVQMAQLRYLEPKTRDPERYARLKVQDVDAADARSRIVRLADADGTVLAEAIFGDDRFFMGGGPSKAGVYLRHIGEAQAWLARGRLEAERRLREWVVRDIVDVSSDRVKSVTTTAPDGSRVEIARPSPARFDFRLQNVPEGQKPNAQANGTVFDLSRAFSVLDLNDVAPHGDIRLDGAGTSTAEVRTFDGLVVRAVLNEHRGEVWGAFSVDVDEEVLKAPPAGETTALKTPDEVRAEAEMLSRRLAGWAYELPANKGRGLRVTLSELLEPAGS